MPMGGGGGGSAQTTFKAQGNPPSFNYQTAMGLNQLAIGGDIQSYALSDQDFARRYPALQDAYNQYQSNLGQQVGMVGAGAVGQANVMQGLANQIAGRERMGTTSDINALRQAGATAGAATQPIYNLGAMQAGLGQSQAGLAQPLIGMGQQQAGIGQGIAGLGGQLAGAAQIPYAMGQQLLQEPIDPQTQQQLMRAGLGSAAGALGAASLGQGMAGQAAAARQLGLSTLQYGQQMRGEAMQDIGQYSSMLGAAGQMQGLGAQTIGAGGQTIGLGGQQLAQGAGTIGAGAQTYGLGAGTAAQAGGLYGQAQGLQEQAAMNTAQMAGIYGGLQQSQAQNLLGSIANAGQQFAKRPFGLGGSNLAQAELAQAGAYNSFQQANYATMNGIAYNSAQMQAQNAQLNAQQAANQQGMMISSAGVAVSAASIAAMSCWVAQTVYGKGSRKWRVFRHWLLNKAPARIRCIYLRHGEAFSKVVGRSALLRAILRTVMDPIIERTVYVGY